VAPFQTHYYSENLVEPGTELPTSGSVARISDHQTTEAPPHPTAECFESHLCFVVNLTHNNRSIVISLFSADVEGQGDISAVETRGSVFPGVFVTRHTVEGRLVPVLI
jgi:hypothetical protein